MSSRYFQFEQSTLHYTILGNGPHSLLTFHGFGQDIHSFSSLSQILSPQYTAYIFDLYFHGQSIWGYEENTLEKSYWKRTLSHFFEQHKIEKFSVVGYSLGGKFALATLEAFPERTTAILLLAPDGIKKNFWYQLATYPLLSRKLFKSMIDHPERFQSVARMLHKWGMVSNGVLKFAEFQMNTREKRARVYYSWVVFRHLSFNLNHIAHVINRHGIVTTVIVGQYDQVIKPRSMQRLLKKLNRYNFETPEVGHTGLISASGEYFNDSKFLAG